MKRGIIWVFVAGLAVFLLSCAGEQTKKSSTSGPVQLLTVKGATYMGSETCEECHEGVFKGFSETPHGKLLAEGSGSCESCHGPASVHEDSEDPKDIITFKKDSMEAAQLYGAVCFKCHKRTKELMDWRGSSHAQSGVACVSCHRIHARESVKITSSTAQPYFETVSKSFLKSQEPGLCYQCHKDIQAKASFPSHHPIREGKMTCSDCHNPHGGIVEMLKTKERLNSLCYKCHADKQGPYAFEHAPVVEDCTICHEPHGTAAHNLLKRVEPFLCLQCHHSHFQIFEHKDVQYTAATRCTQCHVEIHGSNHPSQGAPAGGRALTR